jgi:hypothetical protein
MPAPVLQFKRGIFSNLPGLRAGEPGFTTDSYELYVGIDSTTQKISSLVLIVTGQDKLQPQEVV